MPIIPAYEKKKKLSGRSEFYNLIVTNRRVVAAKTGGTFFATRGLVGAMVKSAAEGKQEVGKFEGKDLEEIIASDKNNFAIPFTGFDQIKVFKRLGRSFLEFKLNKEGKKIDRSSSVPKWLIIGKQYFEDLKTTLENVAGTIVKI